MHFWQAFTCERNFQHGYGFVLHSIMLLRKKPKNKSHRKVKQLSKMQPDFSLWHIPSGSCTGGTLERSVPAGKTVPNWHLWIVVAFAPRFWAAFTFSIVEGTEWCW